MTDRPICCIKGCTAEVHAWEMCRAHYLRDQKGATPAEMLKPIRRRGTPPRICEIDGCEEVHYGKGLCRRHYRVKLAGRDPKTHKRMPQKAHRRKDAQ